MSRRRGGSNEVEDYRGVPIRLDLKTGEFYTGDCEEFPEETRARTLPELRSVIDKAGKVKRLDAPGFMLGGRYLSEVEGIRRVTVTSVVRERGYRGIMAWVKTAGEHGSRSKENAESVYKDTPANIDIAKNYLALRKKEREYRKLADAEQEKLESFKGEVKEEPKP